MNFTRTVARAAAIACFVALTACGKGDAIGTDLVALNTAGQTAMASANVQQAMAKVQAAKTNEERAGLMRETATAFESAKAELKKPEMKSDEGRSIQSRMVGGFDKAGSGAKAAADAFEKSDAAGLETARTLIKEGQTDFIAAGADMVKLAKQRSIDLNKKS